MAHNDPQIELRDKTSRPWPVLIAVIAIGLIALVLWLGGRQPTAEDAPVITEAAAPASTEDVQFTQLVMSPSPADEVAGTGAMYLQGLVLNTGERPLDGIITEVVLRDKQGEEVHRGTHPLVALNEDEATPREVPLDEEPLRPNESRPFRIVLQRVPAEWNKAEPEIQVVSVTATTDEPGVEVTPQTAGEGERGPAAEPPSVAQPQEEQPKPQGQQQPQ